MSIRDVGYANYVSMILSTKGLTLF
jgi:hypothetical protein